jgi:hypothetical protein
MSINQRNETKKEFKDVLYLYIDSSIFEGTLQEVSQKVLDIEKRLRTEHAQVIQNPDLYIRFEIHTERDCDGYLEVIVKGIRLETDDEFTKRLEKSARASETAKRVAAEKKIKDAADELKLYQKLKLKYDESSMQLKPAVKSKPSTKNCK